MSSFLVSDTVINSIIEMTQEEDFFDTIHEKLNDLDLSDSKELGQSLVNMNYESVNNRYGSKEKPTKFELKKTDFNVYQKLKNLQCFQYQCSEGNVPQSKLFKFIEELIIDVTDGIVRRNHLYENAKWGTS